MVRGEELLSSCDLTVVPKAELIGAVRRFVEDAYTPLLEDLDLVERMAMTAHELLENAVKYTAGGLTKISIELRRRGENGRRIVIRTTNNASDTDVSALVRLMEEMALAESPTSFYQRLLRRTAPLSGCSGLGLARIRAEGEMTLSYRVESGEVSVIAEIEVPGGNIDE